MTSQPPHDLDAERAVLGAMLMSGTAIDDVGEVCATADFYRPAHQQIAEALIRLRAQGAATDPVALADQLRRDGTLQRCGGAPGLHTLLASAPAAVTATHHARIVAEHAERRHWIEAAERIRQAAASPGTELDDLRQLARSHLNGQAPARSAGDRPASRRLVLTPAAHIEPRPVRWGWLDRLPAAHLGLIPGREGIGKSLLLTWLIAQITRGTLPGVFEGTPRPVFYAATEDSWQHTIVPRLIAAGADRDLVYRVEVEAIETSLRIELTMPRDCELLAAEVKRLDVAMVALDPLMSVIDRAVDTYNDREMRTVLEPLGQIAAKTGCMIVGLAHFNKSMGDDPLNLMTGSRAFGAVARSVIAVARDPDAEDRACVVSQAKNNLGRLDLPNLTYVVRAATIETAEGDAEVGRLHFTGESAKSVRDILADTGSSADRTERAECAIWLKDLLVAGPRRTKDVECEANVVPFSKRTLERARRQLHIKADQLATGPRGRNEWWLSLPADADRHDPS
jgi:DnaB-like helicase N terminal domain/AAA domain